MYQTGPKRHVCRRVRRETAGAAVQASADAGQHVGGARCGDCVGNGHDVQADHHEVGDMHGGRPEHREPGRGCTVDVNTMVGVVAVLTTSSLSRIEGIGIGEGATMFGPTTASGENARRSAWTSRTGPLRVRPVHRDRRDHSGGHLTWPAGGALRICQDGGGDVVPAFGTDGLKRGGGMDSPLSDWRVVETGKPHRSAHEANGGLSSGWHQDTRPAPKRHVWPRVRQERRATSCGPPLVAISMPGSATTLGTATMPCRRP
jgi:hypothetical protein